MISSVLTYFLSGRNVFISGICLVQQFSVSLDLHSLSNCCWTSWDSEKVLGLVALFTAALPPEMPCLTSTPPDQPPQDWSYCRIHKDSQCLPAPAVPCMPKTCGKFLTRCCFRFQPLPTNLASGLNVRCFAQFCPFSHNRGCCALLMDWGHPPLHSLPLVSQLPSPYNL